MSNKFAFATKSMLLASAASLAMGASSLAQEYDEIIVTATKRAESIQDIPISLEAVTGQTLEDFGIQTLTDLSSLVPNFTVGEGITTTAITMRGLGSGQERSFEQAVGMFIDGQYMPRSRQYRSPFFDIERVEVVKGPQAVYFGLNSTAGAVSIISRKNEPGSGSDGYLSAEYDLDYGGPSIEGAAGFSDDRFGARIAGRVTNSDGFSFNTLTDTDEGDTEEQLLRFNAAYKLSDSVTLRAKFENSDYSIDGHIGEIYGLASTAIEVDPVLGETDGVLNWRRSSNGDTIGSGVFEKNTPGTEATSTNLQFGVDFEMDNGGVVSAMVTNSKFEYNLTLDLDTTYLSVLDAAVEEDYEQTAAEIRYTSPDEGAFGYMFGAYYHDTSLQNAQPNIYGAQAGLVGSGLIDGGNALLSEGQFELDSSLISAFGIIDFDISDRMTASVGARYSDESKDVLRDSRCLTGNSATGVFAQASLDFILAGAGLCPALALNGFTDSRSSSNIMPEARVSYDLSDNVMLYGNLGKSAKAGGFASATNARAATLQYDDESVLGGEIGFKSTLMDGRAKLNAALFRSDFKDLQVNSFVVTGGVSEALISNAAEATSQGIEVDGSFDLGDYFTVGGSFAWLDAEFDNFSAAPCNRQLTPDAVTGGCDLSGMSLPFAAEYSGNVFANVDVPVSDNLSINAGALYAFSDDYFTDGTLDATAIQDGWGRLSGHIGLAVNDHYKLELIGSNLTNEKVLGSTQPFGGSYNLGYLDPPRRIMVRATVGFGK